MRIEGVALKEHGDTAIAWGKIVDDFAAYEDFAGGGRFQAGNHAQKSGFTGAGRPEENQKLSFASLEVHIVDGSELSFFEYLCQIACRNDSHRAPVLLFPSGKDTLVFHFGEHGGNDPCFESFVDGGRTVTGITDVGGPIENVAEDFVFVRGSCPRIIGDFLLEAGDGAGEAREIVKLASGKAVVESIDVIDEELLRAILVVSKVPDDVTIHDVLGGNAANRTLKRLADHYLTVDGQMLPLGLASDGDGIRNEGNAAGEHGLVVGWWSPSEDLRSFGFLIKSLHEFQGFDGLLGIDGDVAGFILLGTAKGPEQCAHGHAGIEFLRQSEAAGMAGLVANLLGAYAQVRPSLRPRTVSGTRYQHGHARTALVLWQSE